MVTSKKITYITSFELKAHTYTNYPLQAVDDGNRKKAGTPWAHSSKYTTTPALNVVSKAKGGGQDKEGGRGGGGEGGGDIQGRGGLA